MIKLFFCIFVQDYLATRWYRAQELCGFFFSKVSLFICLIYYLLFRIIDIYIHDWLPENSQYWYYMWETRKQRSILWLWRKTHPCSFLRNFQIEIRWLFVFLKSFLFFIQNIVPYRGDTLSLNLFYLWWLWK